MSETIFKLSRVPNAPISDEELISDLLRIAKSLGTSSVTNNQYEEFGIYNATTLKRRFGSWNKAIEQAGLGVSLRQDYVDSELFENILALWQHRGRQPRLIEAGATPSRISGGTYKRRFGSWMNALKAFCRLCKRNRR